MNPLIAYVRARAEIYAAYLMWRIGDKKMRGFQMHLCKRDWEMAAAIYRFERRKIHDRNTP